jgi:uncharacterized BrkB/YihY/UPF0761 family membrane protein
MKGEGRSSRRAVLWVITTLCFLAAGYSVMALMMIASFAGDPNYSRERANFNANLWGSPTIIFFILGVIFSFLIWRRRRRS